MSTQVLDKIIAEAKEVDPPRCEDFDDECPDVACKTTCWLHAPELGYCPFLRGEEK